MITHDELKKLAGLAKLSLEGEDTDALIRDLDGVLEFADQIAQAAADLPDHTSDGGEWAFRADSVAPSYPVEDVLSNAGEQQDGYYVARKRGGLPL